MCKYYTWIVKLPYIQDCITFGHRIYRQNTRDSDNRTILKRIILTSTIIFKVVLVLYALTILLVAVRPFVSYLIFGDELDYVLPAQLPGIDGQSTIGYGIVSTFHVVCCVIAFLGSTGNDLGFIAILLNGFSFTELIRNEFNRINEMATKKNVYSGQTVKHAVRNVIRMHQDFRS